MSPLPTDAVKTGPPRSLFTTIAISVLIALGIVVLVYFLMAPDPEPDRPPIIVDGGSVNIQTSAAWTDEGGNHFRETVATGKSVKSFSAMTGTCTVAGKKLTVTFGGTSITLEPKRKGLFGKRDAVIDFPTNTVVVNSSTSNRLTVATTDALVSVSNGTTTCAVAGQRIEIKQVH